MTTDRAGERSLVVAIGDIHGRRDLLAELISECLESANQRGISDPLFIFLGDLIDRGPGSAGVISYLRAFGKKHRLIVLCGNHDAMMVQAVCGGRHLSQWALNGGAGTWRSYGLGHHLDRDLPGDEKLALISTALRQNDQVIDDAKWISSLPLAWEDRYRVFAHAGIRPGIALADQHPNDLMWIREPFLRHRGSFGKLVVHGHSALATGEPDLRHNRLNIDTKAYSSNVLTAAVFTSSSAVPVAFLQTGKRPFGYRYPTEFGCGH